MKKKESKKVQKKPKHKAHDLFFKAVFSKRREAANLLRSFGEPALVNGLDFRTLRRDHLLENDLLPLAQPYNTAPWNYNGSESVVNFPEHTVDWVLVEARSGIPNLSVANTTVVETKAALLLADGRVVAPDGGSLIFDGIGSGNYHLSVRHRNHLDVLSANASTENGIIYHDFTLEVNSVFGPEQVKQLSNGKFALYSADYDPNGVILNTDYDQWQFNPAINQTYSLTDGNLDQVVQVTDYDLWSGNKAKVGIVELQY